MPIQIQGSSGATADVDGTGFRALRVTVRPLDYGVLGHYSLSADTGIYSGIAAGAIMLSARWTDATRFAVIYRFGVTVAATVAATVAGIVDRALFITRSFTVADSGGTAMTLTLNNQKLRTSMGTSLMGSINIMTTAALTAGTGTDDAQAAGKAMSSMGTAALTAVPNFTIIPLTELLPDLSSIGHPIVLAQNEGVRVRMVTAQPTSSSMQTHFDMRWAEATAF